jgi:hypothetical protein
MSKNSAARAGSTRWRTASDARSMPFDARRCFTMKKWTEYPSLVRMPDLRVVVCQECALCQECASNGPQGVAFCNSPLRAEGRCSSARRPGAGAGSRRLPQTGDQAADKQGRRRPWWAPCAAGQAAEPGRPSGDSAASPSAARSRRTACASVTAPRIRRGPPQRGHTGTSI